MLDHTSDTDHRQWISESTERFGALLATGRFRIRENRLLNRSYVPERLIALSSGLMCEDRSAGRIGRTFKFRLELLDKADQLNIRRLFGEDVEWVNAKQISAATNVSRSTANRRCESTAALLILARDRMRIISGEVAYSTEWLIRISNPSVQQRIREYYDLLRGDCETVAFNGEVHGDPRHGN